MPNPTLREDDLFAANIPRYFAYTALKGFNFGLIIATWVIFMQQQHGLNLTQVTLTDVAFWLAATIGEVPTGIVADTFGRKASLAVGTAIMAVSLFAWALVPTVLLVVLAYVTLAIGTTFLTGAEDAFSTSPCGSAGATANIRGWRGASVPSCWLPLPRAI